VSETTSLTWVGKGRGEHSKSRPDAEKGNIKKEGGEEGEGDVKDSSERHRQPPVRYTPRATKEGGETLLALGEKGSYTLFHKRKT